MAYKLTDLRFDKAKPVLEKYRGWLHSKGRVDAMMLEKELRDCWDMGYQELKSLMIDMLRKPRFRPLAAYYMQHQNPAGPVAEFKRPLASVYGDSNYDPKDKSGNREKFWAKALSGG